MTDKDLMKRRRIQVFEDWEAGRYESIEELTDRYGFSRQWFYRWKDRWMEEGPDGMYSKKPGPDSAENAISGEIIRKILKHIEENPAHGADRIALHIDAEVGSSTIQRYLRKWNLGTISKRQRYQRLKNGKILTLEELSELETDRVKSKNRHVEAEFPGQLVGIDLFYIGTLKGIGRIYQFTAVDCYSSFAFAGIYTAKTAENAVDFIKRHVLPFFDRKPVLRVLTDNGKEFTTHWEDAAHKFSDALDSSGIKHSTTKVKHPWTNGHVERFQQTALKEFYQKVLQEKRYNSVEALQKDLNKFLEEYNFERPHQGRRTEGKVPAELFLEPSNQPALSA